MKKYKYEDFNEFDLCDMLNFLKCKIKLKEIKDNGLVEEIQDYLKEQENDYDSHEGGCINDECNTFIERAINLLNEEAEKDRYDKELEDKDYLAVALYDEFSSWQEGMMQDDEEYENIPDEVIWEVVTKTEYDSEFTEAMFSCFDYYYHHNE